MQLTLSCGEQVSAPCDPNDINCSVCTPGSGECIGDTQSRVCNAEGTGYDIVNCDPVQGAYCGDSGICESPCSEAALGQSYVGCEYFPTFLSNQVNTTRFYPAVAISNTANEPATVTIEGNNLSTPQTVMVPANSVETLPLEWNHDLRNCLSGPTDCLDPGDTSVLVTGAAYRIRTTQPVTMYQFSPLDFSDGSGEFSFTNDASLLFPRNAMGTEFTVPTWPTWWFGGTTGTPYPGHIGVTAVEDNTQVTIVPTTRITGGPMVPETSAGQSLVLTLHQGDVLQIQSMGDLSGTRVSASAPVQVMGAHACTNIPAERPACDHLEESIPPVNALGNRYVVTAPRTHGFAGSIVSDRFIRIIATEDNTTLSYSSGVSATTTIAQRGQYVEIANNIDFEISSDKKVVVAQYMIGADFEFDVGDPAMTIAVPVQQFRSEYQFHAPTNYTYNYVNIVREVGTTVSLDGIPVSEWTAIPGTNYETSRTLLNNLGTGDHEIQASAKVGISVYGLGSYTSYWYPGGLDLGDVVL